MSAGICKRFATWADKDGSDEWPFLDLGSILRDHGRALESIDALRTAVHIKQDCADWHEKLGQALLTSNLPREAVAELQAAVKLEPNSAQAHYQFGRALRQIGQLDQAKQEFLMLQSRKPLQ